MRATKMVRVLIGGPMKYHLLSAAILVGAVAMCAAGSMAGGSVLVLAGGGLELWFWARVLRLGHRQTGAATENALLSGSQNVRR